MNLNSRYRSNDTDLEYFSGIDDTHMYPEILIVDDTAFNVEIISILLQKSFYLKCDKAYSSK